jgi:outer membrane protein OmpA-like peptidoglycan-associated protein
MYGAAVEVPAPRNVTFFTEWSGEYDVNADAPFDDNPMRVTPGVRWAARGGSIALTAGWDVSVASEEAGPRNQWIAGVTFGGYSAPVTGQIAGVVRDAETGAPIPGARVTSRNLTSKLEEGYVVLDFSAEGYTPKTRVVEVAGHDDVTLDFALSKRDPFGTIQGRVQDGTNGAAIAARVRLAGDGTWTETDPQTGSYTLDRVHEGPVRIEFEATDFLPWTAEAEAVAGQVVVRHASLERDPTAILARVTGVVKDSVSGRPIDATISIGGPAGRTIPVDPASGAFTMELEEGAYSVTIAKTGYLSKTERLSIRERERTTHDIQLTPLPSNLALGGALFDSGSATIKRESMASLDEAGKFLLENPDVRLVIRGHADPDGEVQDVAELAQLRADAVMKYLVVGFGIDPVRLRSIGSEERAKSASAVEMEVEGDGSAD